jgi:hypothetical protein
MHDFSDSSQDPSEGPTKDGWSIERAVRDSLSDEEAELVREREGFSQDDHLDIARSGAADLSRDERNEFLGHLHAKGSNPVPEYKRESKPIPLFFGSWSGMNPFRYLKPFYLKRKSR